MQIEKQRAVCRGENVAGPIRFAQRAPWRVDQRGDIFDERKRSDNFSGGGQVLSCAIDGRACSGRRGEMADFDSTASDKGQMLRPQFRLDFLDEPSRLLQSCRLHGNGRRETEADSM